jgi:hypothetical protein
MGDDLGPPGDLAGKNAIEHGCAGGQFTVETIREPGDEDPDEYESAYGSFKPELMAKASPTIVYSARKR